MLLNRHANIDAVNDLEQTPLCLAIRMCHERIVELLLMKGSNVRGKTYLHIAVNIPKPNLKIIELLLNYGASVNAVSSSNYSAACTPLHLAATVNTEADAIKCLLDHGANVDALDNDGKTVLQIAANKNNVAMVKVILLYHPDIINNIANITALVDLAVTVKNTEADVIKYLLDNGANVDALDNNGKTLLQIAINKNNVAMVKVILLCYPDINNIANKTALLDAALLGYGGSAIVQCLIDYGFSISADYVSNTKLLKAAVETNYLKIVEELIKHGTDVNLIVDDNSGFSLLHTAVKAKNKEICELLLSNKADVNAKDKDNKFPIFYAIKNGDVTITESLLSYGANIKDNIIDAFNTAVEKECLEIVKLILQHEEFDVNTTDKLGRTPLHYTSLSRDWYSLGSFYSNYNSKMANNNNIKGEIAKLLLNRGADVNVKDKDNKCPIFYAIENGGISITESLLSYGANIKDNIIDAFNTAIEKEYLEIVKLILQHDEFDVNTTDKLGRTPLHHTSLSRDELSSSDSCSYSSEIAYNNDSIKVEIAKLLLNRGADVNVLDNSGQSALDVALSSGREEIAEVLLKFGCDLNIKTKDGNTLLHIASEKGFLKIVELILKSNADFMLKNKEGKTVLHLASEKGHTQIVEALLDLSCNVSTCNTDSIYLNSIDSQDISHLTPLMIAAGKGFEEIIELLLKFGADANVVDSCGKTALHMASEEGNYNVIEVLLKFGADVNLIAKDGLSPFDYARQGSIKISNTVIRIHHRPRYNYGSRQCDCDYGDSDCDHDGYEDFEEEYEYFDPDRGINGCEEVENILRRHLIKLKLAGLYLCRKNLQALTFQSFSSENESDSDDWSFSNHSDRRFHKECHCELKRMKSYPIVNDISVHDIVTKSVNQLAVYAKNYLVVESLNSLDYESMFPIYCDIIYSRIKMGIKRKYLLEKCSKIIICSDVSSNLSRLPFICVEKILFNLTNDNLKVLISACKPLN